MVNFRAFVFYKQLLPSIIHNINGVDLDNFRLKIIAGQFKMLLWHIREAKKNKNVRYVFKIYIAVKYGKCTVLI